MTNNIFLRFIKLFKKDFLETGAQTMFDLENGGTQIAILTQQVIKNLL